MRACSSLPAASSAAFCCGSRFLLLAKEIKAGGATPAEIGRRLSLSSYPLTKTLEQERRLTTQRLAQIHRKLLEADVSFKTAGLDERLVLDTLIAELAVRPARA